jgi:hypothetical protein
VKAVIAGRDIYILLTWEDETYDGIDEEWIFDGATWKQGPIDDAAAIFWDIDRSIEGFEREGCAAVCHEDNGKKAMDITGPADASEEWKGAGQRGDIWDISLGVSNVRGAANDYVFALDETAALHPGSVRKVIKRRHDFFTARAPFDLNKTTAADGTLIPRYKLKEGLSAESTPFPQADQVDLITPDMVFNAGDRIPFVVFYPLDTKWGGSRDDIAAKGIWKNGTWTVEFKRALVTGNDDDIAFNVKTGEPSYYVFDVALFNRTITEHSYSGPISLLIDDER